MYLHVVPPQVECRLHLKVPREPPWLGFKLGLGSGSGSGLGSEGTPRAALVLGLGLGPNVWVAVDGSAWGAWGGLV